MNYCVNCGAELDGQQFCPNCGTKTNIDNTEEKPKQFCINCGAELDGQQFCPNCGTKTNIDNTEEKPKKFCTNCGAELGSEQFCTNCGARNASYPIGQNLNKKSKKGVVAIIAAAVIIIAVVVLSSCGRSYKKVIDEYVKASKNLDAARIINLLSDEMIDYAMDEEGYSSKKEFEEDMQDMLEMALKSMTRGLKTSTGEDFDYDDIKISYKITNVEDVRGSDWRDIKEDCEELDIEPKEAKNVTVELSVAYDGFEDSQSVDIPVIKIGKSWYLNMM